MGGRFGKYGDIKRKNKIRKSGPEREKRFENKRQLLRRKKRQERKRSPEK